MVLMFVTAWFIHAQVTFRQVCQTVFFVEFDARPIGAIIPIFWQPQHHTILSFQTESCFKLKKWRLHLLKSQISQKND